MKIGLTRGLVAIVDEEDYAALSAFRWHATARSDRVQQYATRLTARDEEGKQKRLYMHNVIMEPPAGFIVEHANGNGLDNRRCNLRLATRSQNCSNTKHRANNTSGYRGVVWYPSLSKWLAQIKKDGERFGLGYFASKEEAARAYDKAALLFHGDFAVLNFPLEAMRER